MMQRDIHALILQLLLITCVVCEGALRSSVAQQMVESGPSGIFYTVSMNPTSTDGTIIYPNNFVGVFFGEPNDSIGTTYGCVSACSEGVCFSVPILTKYSYYLWIGTQDGGVNEDGMNQTYIQITASKEFLVDPTTAVAKSTYVWAQAASNSFAPGYRKPPNDTCEPHSQVCTWTFALSNPVYQEQGSMQVCTTLDPIGPNQGLYGSLGEGEYPAVNGTASNYCNLNTQVGC